MKIPVNILDFDQVYQMQTFYEESDYEWFNLSEIRNTNCYCEEKSLKAIGARLKKCRNRGITYIGSGNYHYVTYLFMKEFNFPFTLLLFDHHTDMMEPPCDTVVSCGSWVRNALNGFLMLKKVIIVGINNQLPDSVPIHYGKKVTAFSKEEAWQGSGIIQDVRSLITTEKIYISIDKDVLGESEAVTNWDQGNMTLSKLFQFINEVWINKIICGIDVCGEYPIYPAACFEKKNITAIKKNDRANRMILRNIEEMELVFR